MMCAAQALILSVRRCQFQTQLVSSTAAVTAYVRRLHTYSTQRAVSHSNLWSQYDRHVVGKHGIMCESEKPRFTALF